MVKNKEIGVAPKVVKKPARSYSVRRVIVWCIVALFGVGAAVFLFLNYPARPVNGPVTFGVTFSPYYQEQFGVDWREAYTSILDDLKVRNFRLSAYWNHTESADDVFDFSDIDFELNEAARRDAHVLLAVGRKLPRWPECHDPLWLDGKSRDEIEKQLLVYVDTVVQRYKDHPAITRWQVENEPFFPFGECKNKLGLSTLKKEVAIVRKYSSKPIVVTDSGEGSAWLPAAEQGDILGISMYRESWNDILGHIPFPIGPGFYQKKSDLISPFQKDIIITELQTEPWGSRPIIEMTRQEMEDSMSIAKLNDNIVFAKKVGFPEVYLWGVEWWYWLKESQDDSSFWDAGKELFRE